MDNVEVKVRWADLAAMERRLHEVGVARVRRMRQVDTYFEVPAGRLKLREIDGRFAELIGYRRPDVAAARTSRFSIVKLPDAAAMRAVLSAVLPVRVVVAKTRALYQWDDTRVHLDEVDGLGTFVELETAVFGGELEAAQRQCAAVAHALGLSAGQAIAGSYADLLAPRSGPP